MEMRSSSGICAWRVSVRGALYKSSLRSSISLLRGVCVDWGIISCGYRLLVWTVRGIFWIVGLWVAWRLQMLTGCLP
jgi:hypothetical protein